MNPMFKKTAIVISLGTMLSACSTIDVEKHQKANHAVAELAESALKKIEKGDKTPLRVSTINTAYLGSSSIPVSRDKILPPAFAKPLEFPITLSSAEGRVSLTTVTERITAITGIPVEIMPDVYQRQSEPSAEKKEGNAPRVNGSSSDLEKNIVLNYKGSLAQFLDLCTTRLGISWEYRDSKLRLYRYATKTFEIHALAGFKEVTTDFNSSGEVKAKVSEGGTGSSSSSIINVSQKQSAKLEIWPALLNEIRAYMTPGGKISANESIGTITLTDTPQTMKQVSELLADQNRRMSRTVFFRIDLLSITAKDGIELGVALNAAFTEGNKQYSLKSPASLVSDAVGKIGQSILSPSKSPGAADLGSVSQWAGSSLMINALKAVANVEIKNTLNAMTINNSPVPITMATTQSYVSSFGASQGQSSTQVTTEQKDVTTGIFMQLLPRILDNNKLLLQYTMDISTLDNLESTVTPNGTIKSPTVPRRSSSQTLKLNMGETAVLMSLDNLSLNNESSISIGGSYIKKAKSENILILITPILVDHDAAVSPEKIFNINKFSSTPLYHLSA